MHEVTMENFHPDIEIGTYYLSIFNFIIKSSFK